MNLVLGPCRQLQAAEAKSATDDATIAGLQQEARTTEAHVEELLLQVGARPGALITDRTDVAATCAAAVAGGHQLDALWDST